MIDLVEEYSVVYVCDTYDLSKKLGVCHNHLRMQLEVIVEDQGLDAPRGVRMSPHNGIEMQVRKLPPMTFVMLLGRMMRNPVAKEMYRAALDASIFNTDDLIRVVA